MPFHYLIFLFTLCISPFAFSSDNYRTRFNQEIVPFWQTGVHKMVPGHDGVLLHTLSFPLKGAKGNILIAHGFTETVMKYMETALDFHNKGFGVYLYEHRGHGLSKAMAKEKGLVHVDQFNSYVEDMKVVADTLLDPKAKRLLLAHSMGGGIAAGFLDQYPAYFDAAVLNAPMLEMNTRGVPGWAIKLVGRIYRLFGLGESMLPGQSLPPESGRFVFSKATGTSDRERYAAYQDYLLATEGYVRLGAGTVHWMLEALSFLEGVLEREDLGHIKTPVKVVQAELDIYVKPEGQKRFCEKLPFCDLEVFKGSRHEVYLERPAVRDGWLAAVTGFYQTQINRKI